MGKKKREKRTCTYESKIHPNSKWKSFEDFRDATTLSDFLWEAGDFFTFEPSFSVYYECIFIFIFATEMNVHIMNSERFEFPQFAEYAKAISALVELSYTLSYIAAHKI